MNLNQDNIATESSNREKRVTHMILLMILAFLTAWAPYALLCILRLTGNTYPDYAVGVAMMAAKMGAWMDTIVFILLNPSVSYVKLSKVWFWELFSTLVPWSHFTKLVGDPGQTVSYRFWIPVIKDQNDQFELEKSRREKKWYNFWFTKSTCKTCWESRITHSTLVASEPLK